MSILKDLKRIQIGVELDRRALAIALAYTESNLTYGIKHNIPTVRGICGIDTKYWKEELNKNNIKVDSLNACIYVYDRYLDRYDSKYMAIKKFKGIVSKDNLWIVDRVLEIEKEIR